MTYKAYIARITQAEFEAKLQDKSFVTSIPTAGVAENKIREYTAEAPGDGNTSLMLSFRGENFRAFIELHTLSENFRKTLRKTLIDATAIADSFKLNYPRTFNDTVAASDDVLGVANIDDDQTLAFRKAAEDYVNAADIATLSFGRGVTDVLNNIDAKALSALKGIIESFSFAESLVLLVSRGVLSPLAVTDTLAFNLTRTITDSISIVDGLEFARLRPYDDVSSISEISFSQFGQNNKESVTLSDGNVKSVRPGVVDTTIATDALSITANFSRTFSDSPAMIDNAGVGLARPISELLTMTDFLEVSNFAMNLSFSDLAQYSDVFQRVVIFNRTPIDTTPVTDAMSISISSRLSDNIGIDDAALVSLGRLLTDQTSVYDARAVSAGLSKLESATVSDSVTRSMLFGLVDSINISDDVLGVANIDDDQTVVFRKSSEDYTTHTDNFSQTIAFSRAFTDLAAASDAPRIQSNTTYLDSGVVSDVRSGIVSKPQTDAYVLSDNASIGMIRGRAPADTITTSDTGALYTQSYFSGNYNVTQYVSTDTRTF